MWLEKLAESVTPIVKFVVVSLLVVADDILLDEILPELFEL